jgi:integrase/recombinase XerD
MQGIPTGTETSNWGHSQNSEFLFGEKTQSFAEDFDGLSGDLISIRKWERYLRDDRRRSERTIETYVPVIKSLVEFVSPQSIYTLDVEQMMAFLKRPRQRRCYGNSGAPGTQKLDAAILRSHFQWAYETNVTPNGNIAKHLHGPTVHNVQPKPWDDEQFKAVWALDLVPSDRAALGLGFFCGLRKAEVYSLKVRNVNPQSIVDFQRKGGMRMDLPWMDMAGVYAKKLPHLLPDLQVFVAALRDLVTDRNNEDPLLKWNIYESQFNKKMKQWCNHAGVPQHDVHSLRHSCATNLLRAGLPLALVSRLMNHTNMNTTMRYVQAGGRELNEWLTQA